MLYCEQEAVYLESRDSLRGSAETAGGSKMDMLND